MLLRIIRLLAFSFLVFAANGLTGGAEPASADPFYSTRILLDAASPKSVADLAPELVAWLDRGTSRHFAIAAFSKGPGIALLLADSPSAPKAAHELNAQASREAFLILSENSKLYIVSKSPLGLRNGIYHYLEKLGFRWFLPTDNWTIVPSLKDIRVEVHHVVAPAFRMRQAGGTGGFGGSLVMDPTRAKQERWTRWTQRIGLDGEYEVHGHTGEAFNITHKKLLLEHPEYFAELDGKRQPWNEITKLCYSNPALLELIVKDRMQWIRQAVAHNPDAPGSFAVSVEPADGGGYCDCAECRKFGSVSDRVIFMANAVARAVQREFPDRKVSLFAYGDHAAAPTISIEPSVYVAIIPYGFNRTGFSPEEYISNWGKLKSDNLGLYDYWAIPDWSHGLSDVSVDDVTTKVRFWHKNHIDGACLESDYGGGSIGLTWYLASRLFWDPNADVGAILNDYYAKSFGEARAPMERMIGRWSAHFSLNEGELGLSYRDILEARRLAKDPAVIIRVNDFAQYLHYLRLWYEFQFVSAKPEDFEPPLRNLLRYLWRIYPTDMTHSYRLSMLLLNRPTPSGGKVSAEIKKEWAMYDKNATAWKDITPLRADEIASLIDDGVKAYPVIEGVDSKSFSSNLKIAEPVSALDDTYVETQSNGYPADYEFYASPGVNSIKMSIQRGSAPGPNQRITVSRRDGEVVFRKDIPPSKGWQDLTIPITAPGYYKMFLFDQKQISQLRIPAQLPFVITGSFMSGIQSPRMYFFVPAGTRRVALVCNSATPVEIAGPTAQKLPTVGRRLIYVDVPPGMDGKTWSIRNIKTWERVHMINVPNVWSYSSAGLMIPEDVAPSRTRQ